MEATEKQFRKRSTILSFLRESRQHPSADALYQSLHQLHPDISLATVYRNLALFKSQGLITSLGTVGGIERFDGDISPHDHFVCSRCGCVQDLPRVPISADSFGSAVRDLGCRVDGYQLMFSGVCRDCLSKEN